MFLYSFFLHNFNFCAKVKFLESLKPLHNGQFWSFRKCSHFSNIRCFLELFFCTQELECASRVVFRMFLTILILKPKWRFCKGYSLCMVANFGHFGNVVIFRILGLFWSYFSCTQQLECGCRVIFRMFLTISIFEPNWRFWRGNSPCLVANFCHFGNVVIFLILAVLWSCFLHSTILIWF